MFLENKDYKVCLLPLNTVVDVDQNLRVWPQPQPLFSERLCVAVPSVLRGNKNKDGCVVVLKGQEFRKPSTAHLSFK